MVCRDCYCAPAVLVGLSVDAMGTCRVPCLDADNISCGGATTPIVYSVNVGGIFPELAARLALPIPEYECGARSKFCQAHSYPLYPAADTCSNLDKNDNHHYNYTYHYDLDLD